VEAVVSESPVVPESPGVPAVLESRAVRAVLESPAVAEQAHVLEAERAPSRAGVAALTKWEIVASLPERVRAGAHSAAGDVVEAGIQLGQVAAGVARAWAAGPGTAAAAEAMAAAVAVVVAAVVVVAAAAAAAGGRRNKIMISKLNMMNPVKTLQIASTIVIVTLATAAFAAAAEPKADASATPPANQKQ